MTLVRRTGVESLIQRPDPRLKGALVHGPDRTSVGEIAARLIARATPDPDDPFSVAVLTETELGPERLAEELSALSLTGGRRVVRLRLTGDLGAKERVVQEALETHLADGFGSDALLVIECGALEKRSGLRKAAEAADRFAAVLLYEEEAADMGRLARERLEPAGLRAPSPVLAALTDRLPRDRGLAGQALDSLILYVGPGGTLDMAAVEAALPAELGGAGEAVALSAFSGRMDRTVAALDRARFLGESGPALIRALAMHRSRLARARAAVDGGVPPQAAVKSAGVFWKEEREVIDQLGVWRRIDLERLQTRLLEADAACKTAGAPDELIAHGCALEIARHAGRRGGSALR